MIDLILQGTKANIAALLQARGLTDASNNPVPGFEACWWAGSGQFMTARPVFGNGPLSPPTSPATYMAGFVLIGRLHSGLFDSDAIPGGTGEQWARSKVAQWIHDNGTPGTISGITYYTVSNVKLFRPADVAAWLATNAMPGHEWLGGNQT